VKLKSNWDRRVLNRGGAKRAVSHCGNFLKYVNKPFVKNIIMISDKNVNNINGKKITIIYYER
jgi:hypothetical protein